MSGGAQMRTVQAVAFAGLLALLTWSRTLSPVVLLLAAVVAVVASVLEVRRARRAPLATPTPIALAALWLAILAAGATTVRLERGARNWDAVVAERQERLSARLEDRLTGAIQRITAAAYLVADPGSEGSFEALEATRARTEVDAVALVDQRGVPVTWAGEHRGRIPPTVVVSRSGVVFSGGTLFTYLYAIAPAGGDRRAIAAVLLQAGPPLRGRTASLIERFEAVTGERPRLSVGGDTAADWTLRVDGEPILNARFPALSQAEWRSRVARTGRQVVFGLILFSLVLLSAGWLRSLRDRTGPAGLVPIAAWSVTLMVTPLRRTLGLERLFSPGFFVLPLPGDFVIEGLMVVLLPLAALVSTMRPSTMRRDLWLRLVIGAALAGGAFALGVAVMASSAGLAMLTSGGALWFVLQPTTVVLLASMSVLLIPRCDEPDERRVAVLWLSAGVALSLGLALAVAASWRPDGPDPTPLLLLWSVPFLVAARGAAGYAGRGDRLLRWLTAGWLAATAVIPHLWIANQAAKLEEAEVGLGSFGARGDPFLMYMLVRFADDLESLEERGEQGVDLLYEAWVASGLASEPYPVEISLWDSDLRRMAHLPIGVRLERGSAAERELVNVVLEAMDSGIMENVPASGGGISRILAVPLDDQRAVSVAVAPRASLRPTSALTTFMEGERRGGVRLELLPVETTHPDADSIRWAKTAEGWRSEAMLEEGRDVYHAHLELRMPPAAVRLARGMLLAALDLLILALLWAVGRLARGDPPIPPGGWIRDLSGFRARIIAALFAFFLLPTAVLGWAAYRALAEEVSRAATQVAERAVLQAASILPQGGIEEASARTGEDVLYYQRGVLGAASMPEAVDLGLYTAWMPPELYGAIRSGEALSGTERGELAGRSYLVAYRRLRSVAEVVAVPVWLASRDVAVRQREFAHLVLFGALVGGILSLALSVLVGRALAEPIGELRRAAAAVGRGRLRIRLPERRADEFGELFASFNRMARRLRKARAQEVRTARILAWGEMARQVAHEIKNPLTPIKLSVQHIRRAYRDGRSDFEPILESNVEQILEEIERLSDIARAFSRYGAPQEAVGAPEPVDVAAIARDLLTLYRAPDRSVHYRLTIRAEDTIAATRASELREVIVNLLENARAAVGEHGNVELCVESSGREVRVEVRDDGEGIAESQLSRIFEPHFSTRSSGTGLGLAIVRRLVEGWGGQVGAESAPGAGTTVWFTIPGTSGPTPADEAGPEPDDEVPGD